MRDTARHQWLLVALCAATYLLNLGGTHLWDMDEAYFGRAAQEMAQRGDLIVPYFNGEISSHKPPLMYWIMIASTKLLGVTEFAARIGSAFFAVLNVLLVYHLGRRLFSTRTGLWSGLVLATNIHFVLIARAAVVDQELMFFCTLPIVIFAFSTRLGQRGGEADSSSGPILATDMSWGRWALAYGSMGIGALAKGPVAVVLPSAVIGLFLLMNHADSKTASISADESRWRRIRQWGMKLVSPLTFLKTFWQMRPITLLAAVTLVALPWYAAVGMRTEGEWLRGFFLVHNVARFSKSFEGHAGGFIYYIVSISVGTFPWSIFTIQAGQQMVSEMKRGAKNRAAFQLLCAWVLVWVVAFTLASTKLPHYVFPAYPALAIFFAAFVTRWLEGRTVVSEKWMKLAFGNMIFIGVATTIALPIVAHYFIPGEEYLGVIGLIPLVGGVIAFRNQLPQRRPRAAASLVAVGATLSVAVLAWAAVQVDQRQSSPVVGEWLQELEDEPRSSNFVTFGYFQCSLVYYTDRRLVDYGDPKQVADLYADPAQPTYVLTTDERIGDLTPLLPEGVGVIRETPRFLKPGRLILVGPTGDVPAQQISRNASESVSRL